MRSHPRRLVAAALSGLLLGAVGAVLPVGWCHPPVITSKGAWVGFHPGGPGEWSFQVRVKNKAGWSPWSAPSKRVVVE